MRMMESSWIVTEGGWLFAAMSALALQGMFLSRLA
jgi:hypothetical protein